MTWSQLEMRLQDVWRLENWQLQVVFWDLTTWDLRLETLTKSVHLWVKFDNEFDLNVRSCAMKSSFKKLRNNAEKQKISTTELDRISFMSFFPSSFILNAKHCLILQINESNLHDYLHRHEKQLLFGNDMSSEYSWTRESRPTNTNFSWASPN